MQSRADPEPQHWPVPQAAGAVALAARGARNLPDSPAHVRGLLLALLASGLIHGLAFTVLGPALSHHEVPILAEPFTLQIILPPLQPPTRPTPAPSAQPPQHQQAEPTAAAAIPVPARAPRISPNPHLPTPHSQAAQPQPVASPAAAPAVSVPQPVAAPEPAVAVSAPAPPVAADEPVSEARADAGYLHNPPPVYPDFAQARGWVGRVLLKVHVLASGRADQVELQQSCGHKLLDDAARRAVQEWAFVPAKRGNTAIDSWVSVPIDFKLGQ
ncbi:energy transducer TonB [Silvimonas iriomotensis]|uniref:TonB C-terminal domain-containing protein n=1 Tax=Silvimonas iriomotensis TaxID=449662 RepID=A0ABQ2P432_9NEIS|nr:energy transducer TonB [Silvimonas iriomotensis]GGP17730.1 hypothetical protein GCM10010970_01230 [Silvimonas iriomotensis]